MNELKKEFENDIRELKKTIKELNLPHTKEIREMELVKDSNGDYKDRITAQFYAVYQLGVENSLRLFTVKET
jgi:hypothetical protein